MNINIHQEDYDSTKNYSTGRSGLTDGRLKHTETLSRYGKDNNKQSIKVETVATNQTVNNTKVKKKVKFREDFEDIVYIERVKSVYPSFRMKIPRIPNPEDEKMQEDFLLRNHKELKNSCSGCCIII